MDPWPVTQASATYLLAGCARYQATVALSASAIGVATTPNVRSNLLESTTNGFSNSYIISTVSRAPGMKRPAIVIISLLTPLAFTG